ncbi:MAG: RecX family transcriptional regulator [Phycisphaerae bacterium]|nr:RecX family transcriptional regulator [Phycisphaerae bacterium]
MAWQGQRSRARTPAKAPAAPPPTDGSAVVGALRPVMSRPERLIVRVGRARVGVATRALAAKVGLEEGCAWTADLASAVAQCTAALAARDDAERLLSRRALSGREVRQRLARRGHSPAHAEAAARTMETLGLINEQSLAGAIVRGELARKPAGARLLRSKLARRGIGAPAAVRAVNDETAGRDAMSDALRLARHRLGRMSAALDPTRVERRLLGLLARRGFDADVCRRAARRAMAERRGGGGQADAAGA